MSEEQAQRAETFRELHHAPRLLLLPNVWDPLGARILAGLGYPAVATASAAVANSLGRNDGERIPFSEMLRVIEAIAASVEVPVSADIESGYADDVDDLHENVRQVIRAGAVGINLEDSPAEGSQLRPVEVQCRRIRAARLAADGEGIPLVINARIDVFLTGGGNRKRKIAEAVERGRAYVDAGADCLYPIGPGDVETLGTIRQETAAPVNAYAHAGTAPIPDLEAAGVGRLSLGPNLLRAAYTTLRDVAQDLLDRGTYERFTDNVMSGSDLDAFLPTDDGRD